MMINLLSFASFAGSILLSFINLSSIDEKQAFKIQVSHTGNQVHMTCLDGCAWKELSFTAKKNQTMHVNSFGVSETMNSSENPKANFAFQLKKEGNRLTLESHEGTTWTQLSFTLNSSPKFVILDNYGMNREK